LKFYDQVMTQDIKQTKVSKDKVFAGEQQRRKEEDDNYVVKKAPMVVRQKMCKRKIGRILYAVQSKLAEMLKKKSYDDDDGMIDNALEDPNVREAIYKNMANKKIKLVHKDSNEPIYHRQTSMIGEKGDQALNESPCDDFEEDIEPHEAALEVDEKAFEEVDARVQEFIRSNSIKSPK